MINLEQYDDDNDEESDLSITNDTEKDQENIDQQLQQVLLL